jgi:hypothetical protein
VIVFAVGAFIGYAWGELRHAGKLDRLARAELAYQRRQPKPARCPHVGLLDCDCP